MFIGLQVKMCRGEWGEMRHGTFFFKIDKNRFILHCFITEFVCLTQRLVLLLLQKT